MPACKLAVEARLLVPAHTVYPHSKPAQEQMNPVYASADFCIVINPEGEIWAASASPGLLGCGWWVGYGVPPATG